MGTIKITPTTKGKERFKARVKIQGQDIRKSFDTEQEARAWIAELEATKSPSSPRARRKIHLSKTDKDGWELEAFATAFGIPATTLKYIIYYRNINGLKAFGAVTRPNSPIGRLRIMQSPMIEWLKGKNLWRECEGASASSYNSNSERCICEELHDQNQTIPDTDGALNEQATGQKASMALGTED